MGRSSRYYKGTKDVRVPMENVFRTVKSIVSTGKEDEFLDLCRAEGHSVIAAPDVVNAVKRVLHESSAPLSDQFAAAVQRSEIDAQGAPICIPV